MLTLGESTSDADIFDSVPYRGAQLNSDDYMDAESIQGYAPVVRGIAKSNAKVIIKQSGYVIYQSFVPPGPLRSLICIRQVAMGTSMSRSKKLTALNKILL